MKTIDETLKFLEDILSTLSRVGYDEIIAEVTQNRAEDDPAKEELTLATASISTMGIQEIMSTLTQEHYDQLMSNVVARRRIAR